MGFLPYSRFQPMESTSRRASRPTYVPSSVFRTLSTASSSTNLAGLFHPASTSRVSLQGFSSLEPAGSAHRRAVPSRRWRQVPADVATSASPYRVDLRVFIRSAIRNHQGGFSSADDPYPLLRFAPSGSSSKTLAVGLTTVSTHDLTG